MPGIHLFEATLTVTFHDGSMRQLGMYWSAVGYLIPRGDESEMQAFLGHLGSFGEEVNVTMQVSLEEDSTVSAEVDWDDERGFVPKGSALAERVRMQYPDDCAYLDEIPLAAFVVWDLADGAQFKQAATWLTTGEVRPRFNSDGPVEQVSRETEIYRSLVTMPIALHHKGTVHLGVDPSIKAKVGFDEVSRRFVAPHADLALQAPAAPD